MNAICNGRVCGILESFKPKLLNDLIRLGRAHDGGYVINERAIGSSSYLMGFGVHDDWSFEAEFLNWKPNLKVLCFDYSVSKKFFADHVRDALNEILSVRFLLLVLSLNVRGVRRRLSDLKHWIITSFGFSSFFRQGDVRFYSKGISSDKRQDFVTLDDAFQMLSCEEIPENSVFIKMDIERSEFRVLPDLLKFVKYVNGMVIEFHELDILWANFVELMNELKVHFEITHVHGNNYGGLIPNSKTPMVLEITFLKKNLIREEYRAREAVSYPIPGLDRPNNRFEKDYPLVF